MGTCITSCWTLAQGRGDRRTVKAGSMVKKVTLSFLALIPFLYIAGYVIFSISHSSRFHQDRLAQLERFREDYEAPRPLSRVQTN